MVGPVLIKFDLNGKQYQQTMLDSDTEEVSEFLARIMEELDQLDSPQVWRDFAKQLAAYAAGGLH